MAHLRLSSGAAMLKICEQKGVGDQFTSEQFYNLSLLMNVRKKCIIFREQCILIIKDDFYLPLYVLT